MCIRDRAYAEWQAEQDGKPTWRTAIRMDIRETVAESFSCLLYTSYNIGTEKNKLRPVLVMSNNRINNSEKVVIICITDAKGKVCLLYTSGRQ